jgi:hypothetical protein
MPLIMLTAAHFAFTLALCCAALAAVTETLGLLLLLK